MFAGAHGNASFYLPARVLARKVIRVNIIRVYPVYSAKIFSFSQDRFLSFLSHSVCVTAGRRGRRFEKKILKGRESGEQSTFVQQLDRKSTRPTARPGDVIARCMLGNGVCFITAVAKCSSTVQYSLLYNASNASWASGDIKEIVA